MYHFVKKEKKNKKVLETLWQVEPAPMFLILTFKANVTQFYNCFQFFELRNVYTELAWQYVKLEPLVKWFLFGSNWYPYLIRKKETIEPSEMCMHGGLFVQCSDPIEHYGLKQFLKGWNVDNFELYCHIKSIDSFPGIFDSNQLRDQFFFLFQNHTWNNVRRC